jgi:hypothetical protein
MEHSRRPKSLVATLAAIIALLTVMVMPASAITNGELDGNRHPHVGIMVASDAAGNPMWRCSGTLLSPTVYLTAGHCVEAPAAHVEIWFDSTEAAIRSKNYPFGGDGFSVSGTPIPHPDYNPSAFYLRDVGLVLIDPAEAVHGVPYATLPAQDSLDALATRRGQQTTWFTAVGYGLQYINPVFVQQDLNRRFATPKLNQINVPGFTGDFSMLLSNNAKTGGTCFGDSGGPNFLGDSNVVAAVTSFGINNCTGVGGVFRMDRSWARDWVMSYLP